MTPSIILLISIVTKMKGWTLMTIWFIDQGWTTKPSIKNHKRNHQTPKKRMKVIIINQKMKESIINKQMKETIINKMKE